MTTKLRNLVKREIIASWVTVLHPQAIHSKHSFLWLKTNPREKGFLDILQKHQTNARLLSVVGITGEFSLLAHFQFQNDSDYLATIESLDTQFSLVSPDRYRWQEVIAIHKWDGFGVEAPTLEAVPKGLNDLLEHLRIPDKGVRPKSLLELVDETDVAHSTLHRSLRSLSERGIILGFSVELNHLLRPQVKLILQLRVHLRGLSETIGGISENLLVKSIFRTGEEFNLQLEVYTSSIKSYNEFLRELYIQNPHILDSRTILILNDEITPTPYIFPIQLPPQLER